MDTSLEITALFTLGGAVIGALGPLLAQYLANRTDVRQAEAEREASLRSERKKAIEDFLEATQSVVHLVERRMYGEDVSGRMEMATHAMGFRKRCLELVASPQVSEAAEGYRRRLHRFAYREMPTEPGVWDLIAERRHPFMHAAERELGITTQS